MGFPNGRVNLSSLRPQRVGASDGARGPSSKKPGFTHSLRRHQVIGLFVGIRLTLEVNRMERSVSWRTFLTSSLIRAYVSRSQEGGAAGREHWTGVTPARCGNDVEGRVHGTTCSVIRLPVGRAFAEFCGRNETPCGRGMFALCHACFLHSVR